MLTATTEATERHLIAVCLARDHLRMEELRELLLESVENDALQLAQIYLTQLCTSLRRHMRIEEDLLFPVMERQVCQVGVPVCILRREHREIEDHLTGMSAALYLADAGGFLDEHQAFVELMENHRGREERVLYPAIDRILDSTARAELVRHIRLLM